MNRLTTAYSATNDDPNGLAATDRPATELVFRRARRHSRRVRVLRVTIPILLVVGLLATFLVVYFNPLRFLAELPSGVGTLILAGTKMSMSEPKLSGYTRDERRYDLSANSAEQDKVRTTVTNLTEPRAALEMLDRSTINVRASMGYLDRKSGILTLDRDIVVTTSAGYEARLNRAEIDMKSGTIVSDQPVEVKMQQGSLRGNRLEITKSGEVIRFDDGVQMILLPDGAQSGDALKLRP